MAVITVITGDFGVITLYIGENDISPLKCYDLSDEILTLLRHYKCYRKITGLCVVILPNNDAKCRYDVIASLSQKKVQHGGSQRTSYGRRKGSYIAVFGAYLNAVAPFYGTWFYAP